MTTTIRTTNAQGEVISILTVILANPNAHKSLFYSNKIAHGFEIGIRL